MTDEVPAWAKASADVPEWAKKATTKAPEKPAAPEEKPSTYTKAIRGVEGAVGPGVGLGESIMQMISGMAAKPASDIASLGTMAAGVATGRPQDFDAAEVKRKVQEGMTYQPRTTSGKAISEYNPLALAGKGVDWVGKQAEQIAAPPGTGIGRQMLGAGLHEAINQAPMLLGAKAPEAAAAAKTGLRAGAERQMQSALKPTIKALQTGKAGAAVDTLLDEGINVTRGGVDKLRDRIDTLNNDIKSKIANSTAVIDKDQVAWRLQGVLDRFEKQVTPTSDIVAIQKAWDDFLDHPLLTGKKIPVQLAQEMKQGTYKALGDKSYGELKGADIEAQKALARGLKEDIASAVPEVRPLNAEESKLLNALSVTERRVLMEANKNPVGLGWLTTSPVKFGAWMADRSGLFKSLVARMLNQGSKAMPDMKTMGPLGGASVTQQASQNNIPPPP